MDVTQRCMVPNLSYFFCPFLLCFTYFVTNKATILSQCWFISCWYDYEQWPLQGLHSNHIDYNNVWCSKSFNLADATPDFLLLVWCIYLQQNKTLKIKFSLELRSTTCKTICRLNHDFLFMHCYIFFIEYKTNTPSSFIKITVCTHLLKQCTFASNMNSPAIGWLSL